MKTSAEPPLYMLTKDILNSPKTEDDSEQVEILSDYFRSVLLGDPEGHTILCLNCKEWKLCGTEHFIITTEDKEIK